MKSGSLLTPSAFIAALFLSIFIASSYGEPTQCQPWTVDKKHRIFFLTDIANEPDDSMSVVRLLAHSDLYQVEGLVATTSFWLPNNTRPDQIQTRVDAYGEVRDNLQSHSNFSFPTTEYLSSKISSGPTVYGMEAIEELETGRNLTVGAQALIDTVDASNEPLYVPIWGGANTLATALWYLNRTRSATELDAFTSKVRVYAISDQDDTGPWIRQNFPSMRFIASRPGFNEYSTAAWSGISGNVSSVDAGGPNDTIVQQPWLREHIQIGPLGKQYPDTAHIMEGDTPSLLYHFPNGLGNPEYPQWGSWGGRYTSNPLNSAAQFGDAADQVVGLNNHTFLTNHATIWRWREAFQNEFAARIQWTLVSYSENSSNTTHPPIVVLNGSCGSSHLEYNVSVGDTITLDASPSYSIDANANLNFTWFQYLEPSSYRTTRNVPVLNFTFPGEPTGQVAQFEIPKPTPGYCVDAASVKGSGTFKEATKCMTLHVVVKVKDLNAKFPVERYRRVLLHVQPYAGAEGS